VRLETCFLADAASGHEGKLYVHGGGITRLTPPVFPFMVPMLAVVVRLEAELSDYEGTHEIGLTLLDPTGESVLPPVAVTSHLGPTPEFVDGEEQYIQLTLSLGGIPIPQPGLYRLELAIDGEVLRVLNLPVVEPPVAAGPVPSS
jgi:hypothetical protein